MALRHSLTEQLALSMLAREGIAVIWQLQVAAADAAPVLGIGRVAAQPSRKLITDVLRRISALSRR